MKYTQQWIVDCNEHKQILKWKYLKAAFGQTVVIAIYSIYNWTAN